MTIDELMAYARMVALKRRRPHSPTHRNMNPEGDVLGVLGELAFAYRYGIDFKEVEKPHPDPGWDFEVAGFKVDVKCSSAAYGLLVPEWKVRDCDIYALCCWHEDETWEGAPNYWMEWLGWAYAPEVQSFGTLRDAVDGRGKNRWLPQSSLREMADLDKLFERSRDGEEKDYPPDGVHAARRREGGKPS
jgi:hypothetical protein